MLHRRLEVSPEGTSSRSIAHRKRAESGGGSGVQRYDPSKAGRSPRHAACGSAVCPGTPADTRSGRGRVMVARVARSKTAVPDLPPEFLPRPALVSALDRGEDSALTLVCAPPGYGKTLLLAEWVRSADVSCAWVALDEDDDDPRRLWTSVLAALAACPAVPPSCRLRRLVPHTTVGVD